MALTKQEPLHALMQRAIDSYHAGRLGEAIAELAQNARRFPRAAKLWGYLGFLYGEAGENSKAVQAFRKTAELSPHSEQASLGLFHSLWRVGKTDAAFNEMRRFVKHYDAPRYRKMLREMLSEIPDEKTAKDDALAFA
jgi:lipoprotein NlpI